MTITHDDYHSAMPPNTLIQEQYEVVMDLSPPTLIQEQSKL